MEGAAAAAGGKDVKRLGKAVETVSDLFFFVGTTVALVILISGDLFSNPAADARANLDAAFGAWCQQWTQQCTLAEPQLLVCSLFDETYAVAGSTNGGAHNDAVYYTLPGIGVNATPTPVNGELYQPGATLLRRIFTCPNGGDIDMASVAACTFQTSVVTTLVTFANASDLSAAFVNDCQLQVTWLINAANTFAVLYDVCNFPVAAGLIYLSASVVLLSITTMYILQVRVRRRHDNASVGSLRQLIIYELALTPFLLIIGVASFYTAAGHVVCYSTFQLVGFLAFAIFIITAALALFIVNGVLVHSANALRQSAHMQSDYYASGVELTGKSPSSDWQTADLGTRT